MNIIFEYSHVGKEDIILKHENDGMLTGRWAKEADLSVVRILDPGNELEEGRFSGPRGADDRDDLAFVDAEADVFENGLVSILFSDVPGLDHLTSVFYSDNKLLVEMSRYHKP